MFPQHERGVAARLTDGIRAFLIDVHHGRASVPLILSAFVVVQGTPYKFRNPWEMSCAAVVNAHDALLTKARRCQEKRGLRPTILAVDFYRTGDLVRVARAVNQ